MSFQDLHICQNSPQAESSDSRSTVYYCPPEYLYTICQEGGFSEESSHISWQHFPRSTSTRSLCDDEEETQISISKTKTLSTIEEEKGSTKVSSTEYPITKTISQLNAMHYLEIRHVFQFLNFLISHLVCNEPDDPVKFLTQLLEKCIEYRDGFGDPPHLFTKNHLTSLFGAFDPFEKGHLTLSQYREAMKSLGLQRSTVPYTVDPPLNDKYCVDKEFFFFEAERCLKENINQMLRIPKEWEDNRLLWKKKMRKIESATKKMREKLEIKEIAIEEAEQREVEEEEEKYKHCTNIMIPNNMIPGFYRDPQLCHQPEQLYLN